MEDKIINELTDYFLANKYLIDDSPFQESEKIKTKGTIEYLFDNNFNEEDVYNTIEEYNTPVKFMHPTNLPDRLWDLGHFTRVNPKTGLKYEVQYNLIRRNKYLHHNELKLWPDEGKHYMEPKISYTYDDFLVYFCKTHEVERSFFSTFNDKNTLYDLCYKLGHLVNIVEPIDLILYLSDQYPDANSLNFFNGSYVSDTIKEYKRKIENFISEGRNKIIWRADVRCTFRRITVDSEEEFNKLRKKYKNTDVYRSIFTYDNKDLEKAKVLGPFCLDFDTNHLDESTLNIMKKQLTHAMFYLLYKLSVPITYQKIYFSGNKGFHLSIDPGV